MRAEIVRHAYYTKEMNRMNEFTVIFICYNCSGSNGSSPSVQAGPEPDRLVITGNMGHLLNQ